MNRNDKREFQRVYFSLEDNVQVHLLDQDGFTELFTAKMMDLSEGGFCLNLKKEGEESPVKEADLFKIADIRGVKPLKSLAETDVAVRWIIELEDSESILFGCEFLNPYPSDLEMLREFITSKTT